MAMEKSRVPSGFSAQSAAWIPGWPSIASTTRPESSESAGRPVAIAEADAFR